MDGKQLGVTDRLLAGSMAGVTSQTSIYPLEVRVWTVLSTVHLQICHGGWVGGGILNFRKLHNKKINSFCINQELYVYYY